VRSGHSGSVNGVQNVHGEVISHWQKGAFQFVATGDKLHILVEGCITGIVETIFCIMDNKSGRLPGKTAIGERAAVDSINHFNGSEIELAATANIHGVHIFNSLCLKPLSDLPNANAGASALAGNAYGIGNVVLVPMADKHVIRFDIAYFYGRCQWIWANERVK
jgi:hypothetical protein